MRILVINYEYPPIGGGGGFVTRDILEYMAGAGHDVTIVTSCISGLKEREEVNGVHVIRVPVLGRKNVETASMMSMLSFFPSSVLTAVLNERSRKFDIINTHFAIPTGPSGYVLSKVFKIPNILSIHGGDIYDPSKSLSPHRTPVLYDVVRVMLKTADQVVSQSTDTRHRALTCYKCNRDINIIPLGIKRPDFQKKERAHLGLKPDELVVSTIGRLVKRKNLDDALEIVSKLDPTLKVKFLIMGDGPEKAHLENAIKQSGIANRVLMLGNVSDDVKFQVLDLSDCYLSTAMHEGFGLVFLEAMACGLPIICYDKGGQVDFLKNGKTGFVVKLGDKAQYRKKLVEILADVNLRQTMGISNQERVKAYFIESCAEQYLSLFRRMIATRN